MKTILTIILGTAALNLSAQVPMGPTVVAVQPSDAYIGLSLMEDGELRHYNYGEQAVTGSFYLRSKDGGETWAPVRAPRDMPQADTRNPLTGEYIRLVNMGAVICKNFFRYFR